MVDTKETRKPTDVNGNTNTANTQVNSALQNETKTGTSTIKATGVN